MSERWIVEAVPSNEGHPREHEAAELWNLLGPDAFPLFDVDTELYKALLSIWERDAARLQEEAP